MISMLWLTLGIKPEALTEWFDGVKADFVTNFITRNRWKTMLTGLENTLKIALFACIIGILLGILIAVVRSTWDTNGSKMKHGFGRTLLKIVNTFCKLYITVIRGTPMVIQLMIMYYIVLKTVKDGVFVASLSFGLNSAAYVAEIFRAGIMSIEKGQTEAGRSLGLNYLQTMTYIIAPQMLKNVLPTLCNEFITLLKETSIAGYVAVSDLTKAGDNIRGATYSPFMPLIAVALVYLVLVIGLTQLVGLLERRLRASDKR